MAPLEAISKRKMPALATISTTLSEDGTTLTLHAPGMAPLVLSTDIPAADFGGGADRGAGRGGAAGAASPAALGYEEAEVRVEASGRSTTSGGGWYLGSLDARLHVATGRV